LVNKTWQYFDVLFYSINCTHPCRKHKFWSSFFKHKNLFTSNTQFGVWDSVCSLSVFCRTKRTFMISPWPLCRVGTASKYHEVEHFSIFVPETTKQSYDFRRLVIMGMNPLDFCPGNFYMLFGAWQLQSPSCHPSSLCFTDGNVKRVRSNMRVSKWQYLFGVKYSFCNCYCKAVIEKKNVFIHLFMDMVRPIL